MSWQLQNFDSDDFIRNYWQKKPFLFKNAFVNPASLISPEELAGLACEQEVHSRLILEKGGAAPWQLRYGPFEESDFTSLPASHYTLLVSECEKWIPEFADLQSQFRFIPSWRLDDVMVSYAPEGGSVGAHIDEYDVFLIQLEGQRRWQYTRDRINNPELLADIELAILSSFTPDSDEVLSPGDMLYLPPGVAHHGIAVDNCMTCSIGFRAPTALETLESFMHEIDTREMGGVRYSDDDLETGRHSGEITTGEIQRFRRMATALLNQSDDLWVDSVAKLLTDTTGDQEKANQIVEDFDDLLGKAWVADIDSRFLYYCDGSNIRFYINGQLVLLSNTPENLMFVQHLCDGYNMDSEFISHCGHEQDLVKLLILLVNRGIIVNQPLE